jgi:cation transport ATPase
MRGTSGAAQCIAAEEGRIVEPVYKWEPITDEYKTQAAQPADIEAESQQKLSEIREAAKNVWVEKKAPIGIRVFTWYLFCRSGVYALLLAFLAAFPQSGPSTWLVGNLGHALPGAAARERVAAQQEQMKKQFAASGYTLPDDATSAQESPEQRFQDERQEVMIFLLIATVLTAVVGFMWWNRSWKVRWITMFYAGAMVARVGVYFFAAWASGLGSQLPPDVMPTLMFAITVNSFVFCYLAFWPGVKEWFEEQP